MGFAVLSIRGFSVVRLENREEIGRRLISTAGQYGETSARRKQGAEKRTKD